MANLTARIAARHAHDRVMTARLEKLRTSSLRGPAETFAWVRWYLTQLEALSIQLMYQKPDADKPPEALVEFERCVDELLMMLSNAKAVGDCPWLCGGDCHPRCRGKASGRKRRVAR